MLADVQELRWLEDSRIPTMRTFVEMGWTMQLDQMIPVCRKIAAEHGRQDNCDTRLLRRDDHPIAVKAAARRQAYLAKTKLNGGSCTEGAV
ncbi:hypothetical protein EN780_32155 [Mesorhizobium sp. M4B.F.Ca.ET.089.01.1.1]|uniref:hypothetical protein n=1 Tax=Mesorhizobium sp. M4B.F.Ca.ET.089.01.1.1 TaxID=2496662 RepID=UPI000FE3BB68|nr:hypothetical protein [Mesorhizobium sp. M4B.F.Ca.ET.089.01.1.1]RWX60389.1 hypothetical protein EN780_32155 [Mesorhizobium sp. M4B.F.Ca.ET.089.01.1.1]